MKFTVAFAMLALPLLVVASPLVERSAASSCNEGKVNCCNQLQKSDSAEVASLLGPLGLLGQLTGNGFVGIQCTPITVIGAAKSSCTQQTVCCKGNSFNNNLIAMGCSPIGI